MKKLLLFLLVLFCYFQASAQLDREHWFAPMVDRNTFGNAVQRVYASTNETTPFQVQIYNNNVVIGTITISKNNPAYFDVPRNYIITKLTSDLFKPVSKGIYVKGEKPFYASLRFSIQQHGELLTSKGTAGIGKQFRAVMAPISVSNDILNFMTSVMATEDNTTVTITGFPSTIRFSDNIVRTQFSFTLNKGQSYIIDGSGYYNQNWTNFIGAKIVADKPVSITNGNFNGQYAGSYSNSSDILMDQGVPEDKLGQEFVLMKGNGETSTGMEKALIVAVEDGTQIYLNNSTTPVVTLNTGQRYLTPNSAYINQGSSHYNMYIKSTKNIYVYQLLAGATNGSVEATGGMNYIPPLSCYLPRKIDEIGLINQNRVYLTNSGWNDNIPTKLNIITERAASESGGYLRVYRNGVQLTLNSTNGPFNVSGNDNWVTYSIPNITGNVSIESSHAVTAGISAGNDAVGYGGYFAGFSYTPAIIKQTGDCLPGVILEVTAGFNSYLWLMKVGSTYVPAPGINDQNTYEPTQAGIYAVKVQHGSCDEVQTADYKFYNCTTYTNIDYETCSTQQIVPSFVLSTQSLNPASVVIDTPPTKGTVTVGSDGTITYTANPNETGIDTFKYSFCGINDIPDCETVQATIQLRQIVKNNDVLRECTENGIATYNLTTANVTPDTDVTKTYYLTQEGAENQVPGELISNPSSYTSSDGYVYVRIENDFGCVAVAQIQLSSKLAPVANPELYTKTHCDDEIDGVIDGIFYVNLSEITPVVVPNAASFTVKYYETQAQATAGGTDNLTGNYSFTSNTSIWIRVESPDDCPPAIKEIILKTGAEMNLDEETVSQIVCDNDINGSETVNLNDFIPLFSNAPGMAATFYNSLSNAEDNINPISGTLAVTGDTTVYYRFSLEGFCDAIGTLNLIFKTPTAPSLLATYQVCEGSTIPLDAGSGFVSYEWSNGETGQTTTLEAGTYWIKVTDSNGCVYTHNFVIEAVEPVELNISALNGLRCDENFDGIVDVDLPTEVTAVVVPNPTNYTVKYYTSFPFAEAGGTNNLPDSWSYSEPTTIYIRVESEYCPPVIEPISFGFAEGISLISENESKDVCDPDLSGSEDVNLNDYIIYFTTVPGATASYFNSLGDAQNNTGNISANQTINADRTFFIRLSAPGFCDKIVVLNLVYNQGTPSTTLLPEYTVCEGDTALLDVGSGFLYVEWSTGATSTTINAGAGTYWVDLVNSNGCIYRQYVTVTDFPIAQLDTAQYNGNHCDEDFDGIIHITFSTEVTPVILPNADLYTVRYYTSQDLANAGGNNNLPDSWSYSTPTTLYVRIDSPYCPTVYGTIDFGFGDAVPLLETNHIDEVCDDDSNMLDGVRSVDLSVYKSYFTDDPAVQLSFFETASDAHQNTNELSNPVEFSGTKTFYIRFSKNGLCTSIGTLTLTIKIPKTSDNLYDVEICPGATTVLDVGPGFDTYVWSTGEADTPITVGVGEYWVDLTYDGCTYRQYVNVTEVELPVITSVEVQGTTVTINVTGGNPPYQYSIDGVNFQDSNVFTNVPYGQNTAYVISVNDCDPVTQIFTVIRLLNVITPNGDGYNDYLNYSDLAFKEDVKLQVYDRNGALVFTGDPSNNYTWDGKMKGRPVPTSSYWYVLEWRDPGTSFITQTKGWVLVKNR